MPGIGLEGIDTVRDDQGWAPLGKTGIEGYRKALAVRAGVKLDIRDRGILLGVAAPSFKH